MYGKGLFVTVASFVIMYAAASDIGHAAEIEKAEFFVELSDDASAPVYLDTNVVPLKPDQTCFGWRIKLSSDETLVHVREVLTLPEAPEYWSDEDNVYGTIEVSSDRKAATTTRFIPVVDGWVEHSWCVSEGDPTGQCSLDVTIDDLATERFEFQIVTVE
ncbi:hypothetical protein ABLO27_00805 [Roseibium sp. SCPC15]|uniref:hypothetical protein n=1 Tax=Roseibium sp. SCP15 TaxID=3141376 RepID=UPI003334A987